MKLLALIGALLAFVGVLIVGNIIVGEIFPSPDLKLTEINVQKLAIEIAAFISILIFLFIFVFVIAYDVIFQYLESRQQPRRRR